jgi:iron(III) transport system permease protein
VRRTGRRDRESTALLLPAAAAVAAVVLIPLARLAWTVLADHRTSIGRVISAPGFGRAAAHSLELAVVVPLLAVPIGTGMALALRRPGIPCRGLLRVLAVLPLLVPQFVLGYSWRQAYGPAGFTDELAGLHWDGLTGPGGVILVLVVDAVPISYLLTTVGLATRAQPELEMAARASGAGGWTVLRTILLPLLRPVLAAGFMLTFVLGLESFAAPQVLGTPAGYSTLTTRLYADLVLAGDPAAFLDAITLAFVLLLVAIALLLPTDLVLLPRMRSSRAARPGRAAAPVRRRGAAAVQSALLGLYAALAVVLPTVALVAASITRAVGLPPTPGNWTLRNFRLALNEPTRTALRHSLELALAAAATLVVLGAAVAVLERHRAGRIIATSTALTFAVPGSALAVGTLIAYDRSLGGTLAIILIAYLAKFWALAHRTISGAVDRVPQGEWHAARTSGARPLTAARTIWLPAMTPALLGAGILVFASALHEVTMSSLLYSAGSETFAVAVLNSQELGRATTTSALSVTLTAVILAVLLPAAALVRLSARRRPAPSAGACVPGALRVG